MKKTQSRRTVTKDVDWVEYYDQTADIPMLLISGWYDSYAGGTIDNYLALKTEHLNGGKQLHKDITTDTKIIPLQFFGGFYDAIYSEHFLNRLG